MEKYKIDEPTRSQLYQVCKMLYAQKICAGAAKYLISHDRFVRDGYIREMVSLAKEDAKAICDKEFKQTVNFGMILDTPEKHVAVRELQTALYFFYKEILEGRKDATTGRVMELLHECGNVMETEFISTVFDFQELNSWLTETKDPDNQDLDDTTWFMKIYNETPEGIFCQYCCMMYIVYKVGGREAEKYLETVFSMAPYTEYYDLQYTGPEYTSSLPVEIKKARSAFELLDTQKSSLDVRVNLANDVCAVANVEIGTRQLCKKEVQTLQSILVSFCKDTNLDYDESPDILYLVAPLVYAFYTLAINYKEAVSMIGEEKRTKAQENDKVQATDMDLRNRIVKLEKELEEKNKALEEAEELARVRRDKVGKLEEKISFLLAENQQAKEKIQRLDNETNNLVDLLVCSGVDLEEEDGVSLLSEELFTDADVLEKDDADVAEEDIDYERLLEEASKGLRIILAGCTKPMIKKFGEKHPNIRCTYGNEITIEQTLKNADLIFIHTTSMSHKHYYKIQSVNDRVYRLNRNNVAALEKEMYEYLVRSGLVKRKMAILPTSPQSVAMEA